MLKQRLKNLEAIAASDAKPWEHSLEQFEQTTTKNR